MPLRKKSSQLPLYHWTAIDTNFRKKARLQIYVFQPMISKLCQMYTELYDLAFGAVVEYEYIE